MGAGPTTPTRAQQPIQQPCAYRGRRPSAGRFKSRFKPELLRLVRAGGMEARACGGTGADRRRGYGGGAGIRGVGREEPATATQNERHRHVYPGAFWRGLPLQNTLELWEPDQRKIW